MTEENIKCIICLKKSNKEFNCDICKIPQYCGKECQSKDCAHNEYCSKSINDLKGLYTKTDMIYFHNFLLKKGEKNQGEEFYPSPILADFPLYFILLSITSLNDSSFDCLISLQVLGWSL